MSCIIWYLIFRIVSEDDAHRGNINDCSARALAVRPRTFRAPPCGIRGLTAEFRRPCRRSLPRGIEPTRQLDDSVRVERWFSHMSVIWASTHRGRGDIKGLLCWTPHRG